MSDATVSTFPCPRCGNLLYYGQLVCPNCGGLVYSQRLNELAAEAEREEQANPIHAATTWQQMLPLLPPDSQQYRMVAQRIGSLTSGLAANYPPEGATEEPVARPIAPPDPLRVAVVKTAGSMLISILVYAWLFSAPFGLVFGAKFATGFVILMLIHELGHVIAMRYYGLSASPPIFIPFMGAVINLRQPPRNALEEAIVGIGGPVTGTLAAGATYLLFLHTNSPLMLRLAYFGFMLNLFNMLPVPPLDGGRVTAAVSPWIWITGLLVAVLWLVKDFVIDHYFNFILVLLLLFAWPRVKQTLILRRRGGSYYQIGALARWSMGIAYAVLGLSLLLLYALCLVQLAIGEAKLPGQT